MIAPSLDNPHDAHLAPSPLPAWLQKAGVAGFGVMLVWALGYGVTEHWRRASFVLGAAFIGLAILRLTCDSRILGVLAVRSRAFDAAFCTALGGIMVFLAVSVDNLGS